MTVTRDLPKLLREAERRVNAHLWPRRNPGADAHLASIPANRDTDTDLLLCEAADVCEIVATIDRRLGEGWTKELALALNGGVPLGSQSAGTSADSKSAER
jgi:hypothetical protein